MVEFIINLVNDFLSVIEEPLGSFFDYIYLKYWLDVSDVFALAYDFFVIYVIIFLIIFLVYLLTYLLKKIKHPIKKAIKKALKKSSIYSIIIFAIVSIILIFYCLFKYY